MHFFLSCCLHTGTGDTSSSAQHQPHWLKGQSSDGRGIDFLLVYVIHGRLCSLQEEEEGERTEVCRGDESVWRCVEE